MIFAFLMFCANFLFPNTIWVKISNLSLIQGDLSDLPLLELEFEEILRWVLNFHWSCWDFGLKNMLFVFGSSKYTWITNFVKFRGHFLRGVFSMFLVFFKYCWRRTFKSMFLIQKGSERKVLYLFIPKNSPILPKKERIKLVSRRNFLMEGNKK